jgi:hypothetical protein
MTPGIEGGPPTFVLKQTTYESLKSSYRSHRRGVTETGLNTLAGPAPRATRAAAVQKSIVPGSRGCRSGGAKLVGSRRVGCVGGGLTLTPTEGRVRPDGCWTGGDGRDHLPREAQGGLDGVVLITMCSSMTARLARCRRGSTPGSRWCTVEPATYVAELISARMTAGWGPISARE